MDRETILSQVTKWTTEMGLTVETIDDPSADFHLILSEPKQHPVEIIHKDEKSKFIVFSTRFFPQDYIDNWLELDRSRRRKVINHIRLSLLSSNVAFKTVGIETGIPRSWEVYEKLFLEGATAQDFWQSYMKMKNAFRLLMLLHQRFPEESQRVRKTSLSKEDRINIVREEKAQIVEAANQISEVITRVRSENRTKLNSEEALLIRKMVHRILSHLSTIGSFCDRASRGYVDRLADVTSSILMKSRIDTLDFYVLEQFANNVNSVSPDFNKTPFSFSAELKSLIVSLKASIKRGK